MDAIILAGGSGSRMNLRVEKPLVKICGRPMLFYVVDALRSSKCIKKIYVATSPKTPKTKEWVEGKKLKNIDTPGIDYVSDTAEAARKMRLKHPFLAVSSDLPLINGGIIDEVIDAYRASGKHALSVWVPERIHKKLGVSRQSALKKGKTSLVPAGINIIDGALIAEAQEEKMLVMEREELAFNVNTADDVKACERYISRATKRKKKCER